MDTELAGGLAPGQRTGLDRRDESLEVAIELWARPKLPALTLRPAIPAPTRSATSPFSNSATAARIFKSRFPIGEVSVVSIIGSE
jgi:hypothetical protein